MIMTIPLLPLQLLGSIDETEVRSGMSFVIKRVNGSLLLRHLGGKVEATATVAINSDSCIRKLC
jgi:hypothetical protein